MGAPWGTNTEREPMTKHYRILHATLLLVLTILVGYVFEWKAGGIACAVATAFVATQVIWDGIIDVAYNVFLDESFVD